MRNNFDFTEIKISRSNSILMKKISNFAKVLIVTLSVVLVFSSCKKRKKEENEISKQSEKTVKQSQNSTELSDSEITGFFISFMKINIEFSRLASHKAHNVELKDFAKNSNNTFRNIVNKGVEISQKNDIKPVSSRLERSFVTPLKRSYGELRKKSDEEFDRDFLRSQINIYKKLIQLTDRQLIPNCRDRDFQYFLKSTLDFYKHNLDQLINLQKKVNSKVA